MEETNRFRLMQDGAKRKLDRLRSLLGKSYFGFHERTAKERRSKTAPEPAAKQP